jgi:hypothetical protein
MLTLYLTHGPNVINHFGRNLFFKTGVFVGLCWKNLPGTNTLAYYENSQIMDKSSFLTLAPGDCIEHILPMVSSPGIIQTILSDACIKTKGFCQ